MCALLLCFYRATVCEEDEFVFEVFAMLSSHSMWTLSCSAFTPLTQSTVFSTTLISALFTEQTETSL